jgi:hypothetical protein
MEQYIKYKVDIYSLCSDYIYRKDVFCKRLKSLILRTRRSGLGCYSPRTANCSNHTASQELISCKFAWSAANHEGTDKTICCINQEIQHYNEIIEVSIFIFYDENHPCSTIKHYTVTLPIDSNVCSN